ncbi:hypothetical protein WISP_33323 [Willisornis vidua]|uniref:CFA47 protein n=1 Tax=Willisornis vidua TaxID=1566151 RepID=A0ABQ9DJH0_9PASS|nr:hypothetical protein WISP_33323 [Willisornis vidua]
MAWTSMELLQIYTVLTDTGPDTIFNFQLGAITLPDLNVVEKVNVFPSEFKAYEFPGFPHEEVVLSPTEIPLCVLGFEAERSAFLILLEALRLGVWKAHIVPDPMIAGQVSKPLLSLRSEMNAELRGEDKAATPDTELNEPLLAPVESNDSEDTPSKLFGGSGREKEVV